jgi:hypothetical protein
MTDLFNLIKRLAVFSKDLLEALLMLPFHINAVYEALNDALAFAAGGGFTMGFIAWLLTESLPVTVTVFLLWTGAVFVVVLLRTHYARYGGGR